jgi:SnoaL-like polyketide cyclase
MSSDAGIAVVRRNTEEVQGRGNFEVFEELFASDFVDHTPQPGGFTPDRDGARNLYRTLRAAFPDFHAEIHWQISDGDRVTTYKTYHGTHEGDILGIGAHRAQGPSWPSARLGRYESSMISAQSGPLGLPGSLAHYPECAFSSGNTTPAPQRLPLIPLSKLSPSSGWCVGM